jgi:hypothetical protein
MPRDAAWILCACDLALESFVFHVQESVLRSVALGHRVGPCLTVASNPQVECSHMKRIQVRPGKVVFVSDDLAEKATQAFASRPTLTREQVEQFAKIEPPGMTVYAGPTSKSKKAKHSSRGTRASGNR